MCTTDEQIDQTVAALAEATERLRLENGKLLKRPWEVEAIASATRWLEILKLRGANARRTELDDSKLEFAVPSDEVLAVDEALQKLELESPEFAQVAKLRYFAGLTVPETAEALGVSESSVHRIWRSAKAWLFREISGES